MFIYRWAHQLENDPRVQFKFHRNMTLFWLVIMFITPFTPPFSFMVHTSDQFSSHTVIDLARLSACLIFEISLWANAFTHFGALSGALAAIHTIEPNDDIFEDYQEAADDIGLDEPLLNDPDDEPLNLIDKIFPEEDLEPVAAGNLLEDDGIPHNYNP